MGSGSKLQIPPDNMITLSIEVWRSSSLKFVAYSHQHEVVRQPIIHALSNPFMLMDGGVHELTLVGEYFSLDMTLVHWNGKKNEILSNTILHANSTHATFELDVTGLEPVPDGYQIYLSTDVN